MLLAELGAAFLILAGNLKDALNVCYRQMDDFQLALVLCRLIQGSKRYFVGNDSCMLTAGENGEEYKRMLEEDMLNLSREKKDQWLEHMVLWQLGRKEDAIDALMQKVCCDVLNENAQRLMQDCEFTPSTASFLKAMNAINTANMRYARVV